MGSFKLNCLLFNQKFILTNLRYLNFFSINHCKKYQSKTRYLNSFKCISRNLHQISVLNLKASNQLSTMKNRTYCDQEKINWEELGEDSQKNDDDEDQDFEFETFKKSIVQKISDKHNLYLIQPIVKWGKQKLKLTTPELRLKEAIALVQTLPDWKVKQALIVNCDHFQNKYLFSSGTLQRLVADVKSDPNITAVFVAIDILKGFQQFFLEQKFGVPIFDRYSLILKIFKLHAKSKEAKIQISLAEISYLKVRVKQYHEKGKDRQYGYGGRISGSGESYIERAKRILEERSIRLKAKLKKITLNRDQIKKKRCLKEIPTIAVVGYTNSGKTSLIKAITNDSRLVPRNVLFATLDTTTHVAHLPSFNTVIFMDTIGFISNIPTTLIEAFNVTLKETASSDLIIHIYDASHTDLPNQLDTVDKTLNLLSIPEKLISSMITVGNKIDLIKDSTSKLNPNHLMISVTNGINLKKLIHCINNKLLENTNRSLISLRVPNGGSELSWLYKETTICDMKIDENNNNFLFVKAFMTRASREKFKSYFGSDLVINS